MSERYNNTPFAFIILDGWGVAPDSMGNSITQANTPNFDFFTQRYFMTTLQASGNAVGLKWGEVGNSEVGHLNIGAGKIVYQPQQIIDKAIIDGVFFKNDILHGAFEAAKTQGSNVHIIGLVSDTGVHATIEHLYALLEMAEAEDIPEVYIHAILDGRDAPYNSGVKYIKQLNDKIRRIGIGTIASISGRYYAMDRDNRWDRTERAYRAMINGTSEYNYEDPVEAVNQSYIRGIFDERFDPVVITQQGKPIGNITEGDVVICYNFRADRARQLAHALVMDDFDKFERKKLEGLKLVTFTEYDALLPVKVAFPIRKVEHPLAWSISKAGLKQLHVAETEKYAHVTYFINGGQENPFPGEFRILIPSPKIDSYDEQPEMSAHLVKDTIIKEVQNDVYDIYIVNFANADMVGHTGNLKATIIGVETIDECLGSIAQEILTKNGTLCITADHGNAEGLLVPTTGEIHKEHSTRPVPFIIVGKSFELKEPLTELQDLSNITPGGFLSDIAPTILKILNIPAPPEMTGRSLI